MDRPGRLSPPKVATRSLIVANPAPAPYRGVAVLPVDFRTRAVLPVTVFAPDGAIVPSRIVNETLGPVESDGKRRWTFDLEFVVEIPAQTTIAYSAIWGEATDAPPWHEIVTAVPLLAVETE